MHMRIYDIRRLNIRQFRRGSRQPRPELMAM